MTDPKGSESKQTDAAATEKKPTAKRTATKKTPAGKTAADKKTPAQKTSNDAAPAETPAAAAQTAAKNSAKKPAAAKSAAPTAKKPAAPRKKAAPAETAVGAKTENAAAPVEKPVAVETSGRGTAQKAAAKTKADTPVVAPAEGTAEAKTETPAKPRGRASKRTAAPAAETPAAAPDAASAPVEPKTEVKDAAPAEAKPQTGGARPQAPAAKKSSGGRKPAPAVKPAATPAEAPTPTSETAPAETSAASEPSEGDAGTEERGERKRRGRSRRGRRKSKQSRDAGAEAAATSADDPLWSEAAADIDPVSAFNDMDDDDDEDEDDDERDDRDERDERQAERKPEPSKKLPRRKMFVCVQPDEQVEVVITEEGQVQEYYVEMLHQAKTKGNIYKAAISNVDANLQAAFVGYGAVKNGFLQIDEVHPEYYVASHEPGKGRKYPPIQKVLKPGQEVLVQVVKEPTGTKGAFLTTYLSLAGRFLVLTPGREQIGVSRKVENEAERARLREMLNGLTPGPGLGVIVRTVSMGVDKSHLEADLEQLKQRWAEVRERGTSELSPTLIYQEMELVARAVRDYLTDQVVEVWVDDEKTAKSVAEVAAGLFPRKSGLVRVHGRDQSQTLFERFNIQRQVEQIHSREVTLPSGGRLVIDPTEALTAIDINSGRSGGKNNFEDMAYRTNLEAARMIPLQLRLRDIGGQIVVDFIEMRDKNHWREVEKAVRQGMKVDRARYDVGKMGPFGMLEIVRQRLGSSAISVSTEPCPHCKGTGVRRNMEWQSQQCLREIQALMQAAQAGEPHAQDGAKDAKGAHKDAAGKDAFRDSPRDSKDAKNGKDHPESLVYEAEPDLAMHLLNQKRRRIAELEQTYGLTLEIRFKYPAG